MNTDLWFCHSLIALGPAACPALQVRARTGIQLCASQLGAHLNPVLSQLPLHVGTHSVRSCRELCSFRPEHWPFLGAVHGSCLPTLQHLPSPRSAEVVFVATSGYWTPASWREVRLLFMVVSFVLASVTRRMRVSSLSSPL